MVCSLFIHEFQATMADRRCDCRQELAVVLRTFCPCKRSGDSICADVESNRTELYRCQSIQNEGQVMKTKVLAASTLALGLASPTLGSHNTSAADDIVVGFAVAQSGPVAGYDDNGTKMAQVFIDDINAKGGLLGRKLRAVFADTKSDRAEGAKAGQEVLRQGADIVIGTCDYDYGAPALLQHTRI